MNFLTLPIVLLFLKSFAAEKPPQKNVVKGCLCLECPYLVKGQRSGLWKAKKEVSLFSTPGGTKEVLSTIGAGETSIAMGGEIHVTPGELEVIASHPRYHKGDRVYILQEDAEARTWKVWHLGKEYFEDLSFMVSSREPCKIATKRCWAKVIKPLQSEWWVNLRTRTQVSGWTNLIDSFEFDRSSCL